jgi:hypothetical protein
MTDLIPLDTIAFTQGKGFFSLAEENPCTNCSAPCCRMALVPHPAPSTFMDLDYIRYMVGFPSIQMVLNSDGQWQVMIEDTCRFLDPHTNLCTVHNTPRKPKTCVFFNPHQCWYKRNFHNNPNPVELIRIDLEAFEAILEYIRFDENGAIIEIPTWEFMRELVNNLPQRQTASQAAHTAASAPGEAELILAQQAIEYTTR